ncbi:hypothetical protein I4641_15975 [Waterburya agarophytonicola K14]|uniref:Uncharacterized protein n=1 Tax=Waterburya agarophytonicola KI4 TaxID=2874699 RepID=A0A964BVC2_9CYAN|nr:hypothetical protein [Waterburya agarophytonicola]MCC0178475.1 hypothetical protein [Waterburya agarophytonicola KI4]
MNAKNSCPCCSHAMLHHLSNRYSYWYCRSCRIEMPNIEKKKVATKKVVMQFHPTSIKSLVSAQKTADPIGTC